MFKKVVAALRVFHRKNPGLMDPPALDKLKAHLVKFEGCRLKAYKCPGGKWTIGVGATRGLDGKPVREGMEITQEQADELLDRDANAALAEASEMLRNPTDGALVAYADLVFNFGAPRIRRSKAVGRYNNSDLKSAEKEFKEWRGLREGKKFRVLRGLVRRRAAAWKFVKEETA